MTKLPKLPADYENFLKTHEKGRTMAKRNKNTKPIETNLHLAAGEANIKQIAACLEAGDDPNQLNPYGFNSLHLVATSEVSSADRVVQAMKLLVEAGVELETASRDGRTALYLAAEFCTSTKPIEYLLQCGADPNATNEFGISIVENSRSAKVKNLLAKVLKQPLPAKEPKLKERRLPTAEWREVRKRLKLAFEFLNQLGLVAIQGVGQNQDDAFDDCSQEFKDRGGRKAGLTGICFTSKSDETLARETGHLYLGFWGAPKGADKDVIRVGKLVVAEMEKQGLVVKWDESANERPLVLLSEKIKGQK